MKCLIYLVFALLVCNATAQNFVARGMTEEAVCKADELGWAQKGSSIFGEQNNNHLKAVALSSDGQTLAVASYHNDNENGIDAGHARVFSYNESLSTWEQKGKDLDGDAENDNFGSSVALSSDGHTLAVGRINGVGDGYVRVFFYNESLSTWEQKGLDLDGESGNDHFGQSVALSSDGKTLAVGVMKGYGDVAISGMARVFSYNESLSTWKQKGQDLDGDAFDDHFGISVSLSSDGQTLAVGVPFRDSNVVDSGMAHVFFYNESSTTWEPKGQDLEGEKEKGYFGFSVALSSEGQILAVNEPAGTTRVFFYNESLLTWEQKGQDLDVDAALVNFRRSVALSSDGQTIAVASYQKNVIDAGHVRVFSYNESLSTWEQEGQDLDGNAAGDQFGVSVALSSDGQTLAAGGRPAQVFYHCDASQIAAKNDNPDAGENDIEFVGNGTAYNSTTDTLTVLLKRGDWYADKNSNVTLWAINGTIPTNETVCGVDETTPAADNVELRGDLTYVENKTNSKLFSQDIFINMTGMENSNIFHNTTDTDGEIKFCIRADYKAGEYGVGFAETLLTLIVNMTAGFEVTPVDMKRNAPTSQEAKADFDIKACICNATDSCIEDPVISSNSEMRICLTPPSERLKIGQVLDVDVIQDEELQFSPVDNGTELAGLTTVDTYDSVNKVVITRAITKLFNDASPSAITITGSVLLEFLSNRRRVLQQNVFKDATKTDEDDTASGAFELKVRLAPVSDLLENEDIAQDEEDEEKKDDVMVKGQEKGDSDTSVESAGNSVPINLIVGVAGAVACSLILVVGVRRSRGRSDSNVALKYDEVGHSV